MKLETLISEIPARTVTSGTPENANPEEFV